MSLDREKDRELAYRYDLFVAPDLVERFDALLDEHLTAPTEGRLLEINCGTGGHVIATALAMEAGEVVGTDASTERIALARAKASAAKIEHASFVEADATALNFESSAFDSVVLDASLDDPARLSPTATEAIRVARKDAPVAIKVMLRGSFDEFFSIYWEALHDVGVDGDVWTEVEAMMTRRHTLGDALDVARKAGLRKAEPHVSKEEWRFEDAAALFDSPLMSDLFLTDALAVVPEARRGDVRGALGRIVEREYSGLNFHVSAKALVVVGIK